MPSLSDFLNRCGRAEPGNIRILARSRIPTPRGGTPKSSVPGYWDGNIPWFSIADAPSLSDVWVIDTEKTITQAGVDNSSARVLPEGTSRFWRLLRSRRPSAHGARDPPTCPVMNLAIRGIIGQIAHGDTFHNDRHPDLKADYILANPPFNDSDWRGDLLKEDRRWVFGKPPVGNANFAWVQHFL